MLEKDYKNLKEIVELCEDELNKNNKNVSAVLNYQDLNSLKNILECVEQAFNIKYKMKNKKESKVKLYNYLIFFHHKYGYGTSIIPFDKKITKPEHLAEIRKFLEKNYELKNVGIASYQLINVENVNVKEEKC